MEWLITAAIIVVVLVPILAIVALRRGWFRLVSTANDEKVEFILMRKPSNDDASRAFSDTPPTSFRNSGQADQNKDL